MVQFVILPEEYTQSFPEEEANRYRGGDEQLEKPTAN